FLLETDDLRQRRILITEVERDQPLERERSLMRDGGQPRATYSNERADSETRVWGAKGVQAHRSPTGMSASQERGQGVCAKRARHRGRIGRSRKPLCLMGTVGSNPTPSARLPGVSQRNPWSARCPCYWRRDRH